MCLSSPGNNGLLMRFGPLPDGVNLDHLLGVVQQSYLAVTSQSNGVTFNVIPHGKRSVGVSVSLPPTSTSDFGRMLCELVEQTLRENSASDWQADGIS